MTRLFKDQNVAYKYRGHQILTGKATLPNEKQYDWTTVCFQPSVAVLLVNKTNNKFILEQQYRPALKKWTIEQVAGGIEPGLSVLENAKKEVLEEAGYKLNDEDFIYLRDFYFVPGLLNFSTEFFLAKCSPDQFVGQQLEETEFIQPFEISKEDFFKLVDDNELIDPEVIVAVWLAERKNLI
jgi:ADP-ribose pyrophosphatase